MRDHPAPLWRECKPAPHRLQTAAALTLAALLTIAVMLAFHMPMLATGPLLVFIGMQRDVFFTRVAIAGFLVVFLIVSALLTLVTFTAWDAPWLRVPLFGLVFYGGFYAMRVLPEPQLAVGPLVALALTSYAYDGIPNPNLIFDQLGWLWAIFGIVALAMLLAQALLPPPTAVEFVRADMRSYLGGLERRLVDRAFGRGLSRGPDLDRDQLLASLRKTAVSKGITRIQLQRLRSIATAAEGLVAACPRSTRQEILNAGRAVRHLRLSLQGRGVRISPSPAPERGPMGAALARFHAATRVDVSHQESAAGEAAPGKPPQAADRHDFALRATLATLGCYLIMAATDWDGIHTCMVTCIVTALPSSGARTAKRRLRLVGALAGGTFSFAAAILVVPLLHDLTAFLLLLGIASFAGAWVVRGHPRFSYAGLQFVIAVYLMLLQSPHAVTEIEKIRDRWAGILLGCVAMGAAFDWLRPRRESPAAALPGGASP